MITLVLLMVLYCCLFIRMKDAGVNADFPEVYELDIPISQFSNNLPVSLV